MVLTFSVLHNGGGSPQKVCLIHTCLEVNGGSQKAPTYHFTGLSQTMLVGF